MLSIFNRVCYNQHMLQAEKKWGRLMSSLLSLLLSVLIAITSVKEVDNDA